jgi:hypothetical protein
MILLDNMVLSYLAKAMAEAFEPSPEDKLDAERVAALRLLLWTNELGVGVTARNEAFRAPDPIHRAELVRLVEMLLPEPEVPSDLVPSLEARVHELMDAHPEEADCRIVAEAEFLGANVVVTFDKRMMNRLKSVAKVGVMTPSQLWERLAIPRGTPPKTTPHSRNPLAGETYWKWDAPAATAQKANIRSEASIE